VCVLWAILGAIASELALLGANHVIYTIPNTAGINKWCDQDSRDLNFEICSQPKKMGWVYVHSGGTAQTTISSGPQMAIQGCNNGGNRPASIAHNRWSGVCYMTTFWDRAGYPISLIVAWWQSLYYRPVVPRLMSMCAVLRTWIFPAVRSIITRFFHQLGNGSSFHV